MTGIVIDAIEKKFESWWQKIVHNNQFVQAKDYASAAFRAGYESMQGDRSATNYTNGMSFYGGIISLQEAHRLLDEGHTEEAKFNLELGLKQLYEIDEKEN